MKEFKKKIVLYGGGFYHAISEINNITNYVDWTLDPDESDICIYVDDGLDRQTNKSKKNYGWLRESKTIIPTIYNWSENNILILKSKFIKVFTHDKELCKKSDIFELIQCDVKSSFNVGEIYPKTKLISMITSDKNMCKEHKFRLEMLKKFQDKCDVFGRGINFIEDKKDGLKDYCFSIVIENATYPNMITEKITDCFMTGTIPIYYGIDNVGDFFNKNGIITLNDNFKIEDLSFDLYYSKLDEVKENFEISKKLMLPEDIIYLNFLDKKIPQLIH